MSDTPIDVEGMLHRDIIESADELRRELATAQKREACLEVMLDRANKESELLQIRAREAETRIVELESMNRNQEAQITGRHQYVGQDYQYRLDRANERIAELERKYHELLFSVGNKYPHETRHETALRYIKQAEISSHDAVRAKEER